MTSEFPIDTVRSQFPALERAAPFVYFDNAAGAQAPKTVLDTVAMHLLDFNVQRGGRYSKSVEVDRVIAAARAKVAAWINAYDASEICFGLNATSFIRMASLAIGQTLKPPRNRIVVTDLDHAANISTWQALEPMGAEIVFWKMRDDGRLHVEDLVPLLDERVRIVACTTVSHALGSLVDAQAVARAAHAVGAEVFLDSVHYGPHALADVQRWDCDYLVCSGYKAFAPHMGFLWGRKEKLAALPFFREEFIPDEPPYKVEAGTFVYENVAGMGAAVDYFEALGRDIDPAPNTPRGAIETAMHAIRHYEQTLAAAMLKVLREAGAIVYGISDPDDVAQRVPTICFNLPDVHPRDVVELMTAAGFGIRDGHMYAPKLMARLGLAMDRGCVRVSLVHYNSLEEVECFGKALKKVAK